ncbi:MAG: hypothetical protein HKO90_09150 [Flavobacteriaceae bacterium]|nr:hypothetical protein [Bacteroidia bacterium]NNK88437.1 hypothetical protein [Flavobacteriaceae bacterium]
MTQVFWSCKKSSEKDKITEPKTNQIEEEPVLSPITGKACKFEMALQTDEFIREIDTLKGYEWDDKTKSAHLMLNDHWRLTLRRGGCDHFELSATFLYDRTLEFESNREMIFDQAKWITGLIPEFDSAMIAEALDSSKFVIQPVMEGQYYINFTDERMSDYYQFEYQTWDDSTKFKIGRYYE